MVRIHVTCRVLENHNAFHFLQDPTSEKWFIFLTHNTECYNQDVVRRVDRPATLSNRDKVHLIKFRSIRLKINRCCVISLAQYIKKTCHDYYIPQFQLHNSYIWYFYNGL